MFRSSVSLKVDCRHGIFKRFPQLENFCVESDLIFSSLLEYAASQSLHRILKSYADVLFFFFFAESKG